MPVDEDKASKIDAKKRAQIINIFANFVCMICGLMIGVSAAIRILDNYGPIAGFLGSWRVIVVPEISELNTGQNWYNFIHFWVISIYLVFFALIILLFSVWFGGFLKDLLGFYGIWFGRGMFFILAGFLMFSTSLWDIIMSSIIVLIGILFLPLYCIPIVPIPRGFLDCGSSSK